MPQQNAELYMVLLRPHVRLRAAAWVYQNRGILVMKSLLHQSREKKGLCGPKDPPIQPDSRGIRGNIEQTPSSPPVSDRLRACCGITKKQAYILPGNSVHPRAMPPSALVVL